jgi:uncharacterized protein (TIGR04255 family)
MMDQPPLPKYRRPPVIETVLGVQFSPLKSFSIPHFGLFWAAIRADYPMQEIKPPLGPVMERFGVPPPADARSLTFTSEPEARCWFIDASGTQLIQVQRDRFIRNWRKVTGSEDYPSYEYLKPRFRTDWLRFLDFLEREEIDRPEVNQCEVTYINHISAEDLGDAHKLVLGDAHKVVHALSPLSGAFLPDPEMAHINVRYVMGDKSGRLHVNLQPAVRLEDSRVVLQLTLTARGTPSSSRIDDILLWFDAGHEWVVRGFTDFTKADLHVSWGRIQ